MRHHSFITAALMFSAAVSTLAGPISIDVHCPEPAGAKVGTITVDSSGTGIAGSFVATKGTPPSLAATAAFCGEDHFNWYQIVTADNQAPKDRKGNQLVPPYVDPPPGGYDPAFDPTWADDLPWYYDEYLPKAGTKNVNKKLQLSAQSAGDTLNFGDFPGGPAGLKLSFKTWLVSLNKNGSLHSFHPGFSWDFEVTKTGRAASNIKGLNQFPTDAEYKNITQGFAAAIPEPATWLLVSSVLLLAGRRRR